MKEMEATGRALRLRIQSAAVQGPKRFDDAFAAMTHQGADSFIVFPDPLTFSNQEVILNFAAKSRIPGLFGAMEFVEMGGLMSYGPSYPGMFRRGAYYVDRILKGTNPSDLPVEQPDEVRIGDQFESGKADRPLDSTQRAGESGQSHKMTVSSEQ
jgi:putative ABC transport system substrate-binding protein